ncbi:MAG: hypothetical protein HY861_00390 [Chlamydiia bacterium]|nr:hypothetical protein [Chlamydiia bacterium]
MRICLLVIAIAFLIGCEKVPIKYQLSTKQQLADTNIKRVAIKLKNEFGLIPCGTAGQMMHQIQMLGLMFDYRQSADIEAGRKLLIAAIQELISAVNADEQLRPYLNNYPFCPKNIEIEIYLQNHDGSRVDGGRLSVITARKGILEYKIAGIDPRAFSQVILTETYEEALARASGHAASPQSATEPEKPIFYLTVSVDK